MSDGSPFFSSGFFSTGFFSDGFWCDGAKTVEARSGYWRLFYMNMQAASEEKHRLARLKDESSKLQEPVKIKVRYLKDRAPEPAEKLLPESPPQVKLAPLKFATQPSRDQDFTIFELNKWLEFTIASSHDKVVTSSAQSKAANDETLLLLLLA